MRLRAKCATSGSQVPSKCDESARNIISPLQRVRDSSQPHTNTQIFARSPEQPETIARQMSPSTNQSQTRDDNPALPLNTSLPPEEVDRPSRCEIGQMRTVLCPNPQWSVHFTNGRPQHKIKPNSPPGSITPGSHSEFDCQGHTPNPAGSAPGMQMGLSERACQWGRSSLQLWELG